MFLCLLTCSLYIYAKFISNLSYKQRYVTAELYYRVPSSYFSFGVSQYC
jgi:hypothetical protein